mgnify:CR=1 FL=1
MSRRISRVCMFGALCESCMCVCAAGRDEDVDIDGGYEEMGCSFDDAVIDLWPEARVAAGTRIFVLTPLGETLQIWQMPGGLPDFIDRLAVFGRSLIVKTEERRGWMQSGPLANTLIALKGV